VGLGVAVGDGTGVIDGIGVGDDPRLGGGPRYTGVTVTLATDADIPETVTAPSWTVSPSRGLVTEI
jgi:hypothetical protein